MIVNEPGTSVTATEGIMARADALFDAAQELVANGLIIADGDWSRLNTVLHLAVTLVTNEADHQRKQKCKR